MVALCFCFAFLCSGESMDFFSAWETMEGSWVPCSGAHRIALFHPVHLKLEDALVIRQHHSTTWCLVSFGQKNDPPPPGFPLRIINQNSFGIEY